MIGSVCQYTCCVYACVYVCAHMSCVSVCMYACVHVCVCACMCVRVAMYCEHTLNISMYIITYFTYSGDKCSYLNNGY